MVLSHHIGRYAILELRREATGEHHSVVSIAGATASIAGGWTDQDLPELKRLYGHSREFFQRPSRYKEPADMLNASCYF